METGIIPKLILHFDINKTLMLGDKIQNQSLESSLLALICELPLGKIDEKNNEWIRTENNLNYNNPKEDLISYADFLKKKYPKKNEKEIPDVKSRLKINHDIKLIIRQLTNEFVDKKSTGEYFSNNIKEILEKLKVPDNIINDINNEQYNFFFKELYSNGYFFTFKSFFNSIIKLKERRRDFSIIFRTFGGDIDYIVKEFNLFCKGLHPLNNQKYFFDGTNNSKNYLLSESQFGIIYRYSKDIKDIFLVLGTNKRITPKPNNLYEAYNDDIKNNDVIIIEGGLNIYNFIMEKIYSENINSFAFNDEYQIWIEHDELKEYSKPLFINPYNRKIHQIFFDDNIKYAKKSIVDCRNIITGESIPDNLIKDKYIIKSNVGALLDDYYFFDKIYDAERKRKKDFDNKINNISEKKNRLNKILNESLNAYTETFVNNDNISFTDFISNFIYANKLFIDEGK